MGEALVVALPNAVVGALLGALVDNGLGAWAQLLTHVGQSRQRGAQEIRTQPAGVGKSRAAALRRRERRRSFLSSDDEVGGFHARLREQAPTIEIDLEPA